MPAASRQVKMRGSSPCSDHQGAVAAGGIRGGELRILSPIPALGPITLLSVARIRHRVERRVFVSWRHSHLNIPRRRVKRVQRSGSTSRRDAETVWRKREACNSRVVPPHRAIRREIFENVCVLLVLVLAGATAISVVPWSSSNPPCCPCEDFPPHVGIGRRCKQPAAWGQVHQGVSARMRPRAESRLPRRSVDHAHPSTACSDRQHAGKREDEKWLEPLQRVQWALQALAVTSLRLGLAEELISLISRSADP